MKSKIFTKLTCLALCLVTIFCSGCFFSCIGKHAEKQAKEAMQAKKAIAETYIPQCTDYSLKIVLISYFRKNEELQAQGFMESQDFFREVDYPRYNFYLGNPSTIEKHYRSIESREILVRKYKILCDGTKAYGQDFFHSYFRYAVLFDGKFFLITDVGGTLNRGYNCQAPALYLVDFENNQLLYCGYALGFYDLFTTEEYGVKRAPWDFQTYDFAYKIVKNTGESKNEEIK